MSTGVGLFGTIRLGKTENITKRRKTGFKVELR
jgi:hypothetical protein